MNILLQGSASLLSYAPRSQMDYGTVLCRAANLVGRQVVPCVYHVIPAGKGSSFSWIEERPSINDIRMEYRATHLDGYNLRLT